MSIFPESTTKDVLAALEPQALLQLINYRTDTVQEIGDTIKCFCPIHQEHVFRTLIVSRKDKSYRCSYSLCPGNKGGNLIDLYARVRELEYDAALEDLVEKMHLPVALPATSEVLDRTVEEGENFYYLATADPSRAEMHIDEAQKRFQRVLDIDPVNLRALQGLYQIYESKGEMEKLAELASQRIEAEARAGRWDEVVRLCSTHLAMEAATIPIRRLYCQALVALERPEEAVAELMTLADLCEVSQDLAGAIDAYRQIASLNTDEIDVHPMIVNLLVASGRTSEAVQETVESADWRAQTGQVAEAVELLRSAIDLDPTRDDLRARLVEYSLQLGLDSQRLIEALTLVDEMIARDSLDAAGQILLSLCEADPQNPQLLDKLLVVRKRQGSAEEVLALQHRLADLYRDREDYASALLLLEEILAAEPGSIQTLERIAEIHRLENDIPHAVEVFGRVVQLACGSGDLQQAISAAERMAQLEPGVIDHQELVIDLLGQAGQTAQALEKILGLVSLLEKRRDLGRMTRQLRSAMRLAPERVDLVLKLAWCLESQGDLDEAVRQRMTLAEQFLQQNACADAIDQLRIILEKRPDNLAAMSLLADAMRRCGRLAEAHALLRRLAEIHISAENYPEARNTIERLLEQAPDDVEALERLADVYTGLGDEEQVIATLERLVAVHRAAGRAEETLRHIDAILELRPEHIEAHRQKVHLSDRLGRTDKALETLFRMADIFHSHSQWTDERDVLETVLQRSPEDRKALNRLIPLLLQIGDTATALDYLDRLIQSATKAMALAEPLALLRAIVVSNPDEAAFHERLIQLLIDMNRPQEAAAQLAILIESLGRRQQWAETVDLYRQMLSLNPAGIEHRARFIEVLLRLGRTPEAIEESLQLASDFRSQGRHEEAEQAALDVLRLEASNEPAHIHLIESARARQRTAQAIEWIGKLADLQLERRAFGEAIATLRDVFPLDPLNVDTHRRIVKLYTDMGNAAEAVGELRSMVEIHRQTGDFDSAVECQQEAIELQPGEDSLRRELVRIFLDRGNTTSAVEQLFSLAEVQMRDARHPQALETLAEVLEHEPDNLRAIKLRSEAYLQMGEEKLALKELMALSAKLEDPAVLKSISGAKGPEIDTGLPLVEEYTFENFIVGDKNNFAFATALATAKAPAKNYNPLFLYSDVGLGKTHLMQAIALYLRAHNPDTRILYTTSEEFTSRLIDAIQNNTVTPFREAYRNVDVLLLDDVQFLAGKERAQEEFFHIFNMLFQGKKQIVVTSDRPPKDIAHLEKRLKSRFGAGVVVDIQAPDVETRSAIIRKELAARADIKVLPEIVSLIAQRVESNVRLLKGAVNQILMAHDIGGEEVTLELVSRVLDQLVERV